MSAKDQPRLLEDDLLPWSSWDAFVDISLSAMVAVLVSLALAAGCTSVSPEPGRVHTTAWGQWPSFDRRR